MFMSARVRRNEETGVTLVELLVVMVILGVVGGIVTTVVTTALRSASGTSARVLALDELQTATQRISRDLRAAELFIIEDEDVVDREVTAQVFRAGSEQQITYRVEERDGDDVLVRHDTGQTLITLVDNDDKPVFEYLDVLGEPIDCEADCADEYSKATQIRIRLIRGIPDRAPVVVETLVNVRNTRYEGNVL
jgi:prepilin-type N-terminal cleavage/methylation domain-containing protein